MGNIVSYTGLDAALFRINPRTRKALAECDYNLYFPAAGQKPAVDGAPDGSFDQWHEMGFDVDSVIADPLFVDPERDDYRLRPESPAIKLGFVPIDVDKIGIRPK